MVDGIMLLMSEVAVGALEMRDGAEGCRADGS